MLSPMTAPAATRPPDSTFACLTVAPIDTKLLSANSDPWIMEFGPTNTLLPILTCLDKCDLSWITQLSPIVMPLVPRRVAPYQTELFAPNYTFPKIVAFGAMKSAASKLGCEPAYDNFLKLGTKRSYDAFSPSILVPNVYKGRPIDL